MLKYYFIYTNKESKTFLCRFFPNSKMFKNVMCRYAVEIWTRIGQIEM